MQEQAANLAKCPYCKRLVVAGHHCPQCKVIVSAGFSRTTGADLITEERLRQIQQEGYTPEHDDEHISGELAIAAACYLVGDDTTHCEVKYIDGDGMIDVDGDAFPWPDHDKRDRPRLRRLVVAGALIAAEIDRELRADTER